MALQPHWLDEVLQDCDNADKLIDSFAQSSKLREIATSTVKAGADQRKLYEENPNLCGPTVAQAMRQEFLRGLEEN
ncbi:hypothetical protein Pan181_02760 [Aeoliella mucimassa]|uniref:Uncharacterized protein n=2 Tax=Aeoliella mucimassa TaxID=2527972 RepID=A0A518AHA2_9BACT|nr:hypothetical protein Pan181_02760 [Aeoliella mucimassa]